LTSLHAPKTHSVLAPWVDQDVKSRILRILKCQDGGVGVEGALEDSSRQLGRNWGSVLIGFVLMGFCCGNSEVDAVCC